jgi:excisionase family DNA binding protein
MLILVGEEVKQKELLTVKEVAVHLRVSRATVWRWCQQGIIPAVRVGRCWRIRQVDLLNLVDPAKSDRDGYEGQAGLKKVQI